MADFEQHLMRQIAWSRATFGPGTRQRGVIDHIRKELVEVENAVTHQEVVKEWTDVAILALDGLWREISHGQGGVMISPATAREVVSAILEKQARNELRDWPDWRTADPDKAIEHVRAGDWPTLPQSVDDDLTAYVERIKTLQAETSALGKRAAYDPASPAGDKAVEAVLTKLPDGTVEVVLYEDDAVKLTFDPSKNDT